VLKRKKPPKRSGRKGSRGNEETTALEFLSNKSCSPSGSSSRTPTTRSKVFGSKYLHPYKQHWIVKLDYLNFNYLNDSLVPVKVILMDLPDIILTSTCQYFIIKFALDI
jgi:hypothetical protein